VAYHAYDFCDLDGGYVSRLNPTILDQITRELYASAINREYGAPGVAAMKDIMASLRELYRYVEPEGLKGSLVVCKCFDADESVVPEPPAVTVPSMGALATEISGPCIIQMRADGDLNVWRGLQPDLGALSSNAIVYLYSSRQEFFVIRGDHRRIPNPLPTHASIFSVPTFRVLKEALFDYRNRMVRTSRCKILSQVWRDTNRILLSGKPEAAMRDSLTQFLTSVMGGDVEPRPEQIVDESHPVDIKVTWLFTNRHAIIEVKWLGKSVSKAGEITTYSEV
jgi:hypothetical protein